MKACSSEARDAERWCRRMPLANAMSPICSSVSPLTSSSPRRPGRPSGRLRGAAAQAGGGPVIRARVRDRSGQQIRLRRPDPDGVAGTAGDELSHAAIRDEPAPPDHDQVVGGVLHLRHQVAGDEHRAALGRQRLHQGADPQDALRIQPVDRLVEHQDLRVPEQRRGDAEPLAHAEGEALGPLPATSASPTMPRTSSTRRAGIRWSGPGTAGGCGRCGRRARPGPRAARRPRASGRAIAGAAGR